VHHVAGCNSLLLLPPRAETKGHRWGAGLRRLRQRFAAQGCVSLHEYLHTHGQTKLHLPSEAV